MPDPLHAFSRPDTHRKHLTATVSVDTGNAIKRIPLIQVILVEHDDSGNVLSLHQHQKTVQQRQVRLRVFECKHNQRLVDIRNRRPDQAVLSWQNLIDRPFRILGVCQVKEHLISDKRLASIFPENAPCPALVRPSILIIEDIVVPRDRADNLSLHPVTCVKSIPSYSVVEVTLPLSSSV